MGAGAALLERPLEVFCYIVFDAHRRKHDRELLIGILPEARLLDDLRRQLVMRQSVSGKDRELLSADQRGQSVNSRDSGTDIISRVFPCAWV